MLQTLKARSRETTGAGGKFEKELRENQHERGSVGKPRNAIPRRIIVHTDIAQAAILYAAPGPLTSAVLAVVSLVSGVYALIGIVMTEEMNQTLGAIYERDAPGG
jgi:hypothetical protein